MHSQMFLSTLAKEKLLVIQVLIGAGKSTTIKIMCGILVPTSGECIVNGKVTYKERKEYVKDIGVVFGQRSQLWWDVPPDDSFYLLKDIYKIPLQDFKNTREKLIESLELTNIISTPTRQLSLGQRMRCEIAASLLHKPKILFLDEPTIGLDAVSKIAVRKFVKDLNKIKIIDNPDKLFTSILNNFLILDKESKTIFKSELRKSIIKDNYTKSIFYNKLIKSKITDNQNNYIKISKV